MAAVTICSDLPCPFHSAVYLNSSHSTKGTQAIVEEAGGCRHVAAGSWGRVQSTAQP